MKKITEYKNLAYKAIDDLDIMKLDKSQASIFLCQYYEYFRISLEFQSFEEIKLLPEEKKHGYMFMHRSKIYAAHEAVGLLMYSIMDNKGERNCEEHSFEELLEMVEDAMALAIEHRYWLSINKHVGISYAEGEMKVNSAGEEYIQYSFKNEEIGYFEIVNDFLLQDLIEYKGKKQYPSRPEFNPNEPIEFRKIKMRHYFKKVLDVEFNLPDEYRIGPYKIKEIKEIWNFILIKMDIEYFSNLIKMSNADPLFPTLIELDYKIYPFEICDRETVKKFIDDFSYKGPNVKKDTKGKIIYSSFETEPILKNEGRYIISPSFIMDYHIGRNTNSTLNRIYNDQASIDADQKEGIFVEELIESLKGYDNLMFKQGIPIQSPEETNIDLVIFDKNTKTMLAMEIKWLNEPGTPVEIKSKDEDLRKGLNTQLLKYKKGIEKNKQNIMSQYFNPKSTYHALHLFVLTRGSIGSGKIDRSKYGYEIINNRMLLKALTESEGDLISAVKKLQNREYLPKKDEHFIIVNENPRNMKDIKYVSPGYRQIKEYSLD
ncbi:hypothetical protein CN899_27460 [Bacillus thuringiensis]|uniref:Uncharacterized protein n=1 Tax=Bacillus thuringiensis TaxID=1428 RepID=A0A9X7GGD9_BACTU|nr:hypothetical protein [Bacillus thuringiensis]MED2984206.1 hypothetical protein [Bacillus thuringiensis]MRB56183.1 hypothetical protein [Bacillus thuringiensis]PGH78768.1 hypothetical protein CN899_27460 [Bacillus thuringiensis]